MEKKKESFDAEHLYNRKKVPIVPEKGMSFFLLYIGAYFCDSTYSFCYVNFITNSIFDKKRIKICKTR